jgi:hypothetical protein
MLVEAARPNPNPQRLNELAAGPLDWSTLIELAEQHGLLPILTSRLKTVHQARIPSEICSALQEKNRAHAMFALSLCGELFRLLDRFAAASVETVVIKGPVLSMRCYGRPALRQYTDLDLIARTKDIQRATEIMLGLEFEPRIPPRAIVTGKIPGEYVFRRTDTNLLVEYHTEHTFRYYPHRLPIERVFARKTWVTIDDRQVPALSLEDELVLISIHAAKHMWERLGWVADVAALIANNPNLDWRRVQSAAAEVDAQRMLCVGILLATQLLEVPLSSAILEYVERDSAAVRIAAQIAARLEQGSPLAAGVLNRAAFRVKMRRGLLPGLAYLLRLSLSPTEDDWSTKPESNHPWLFDALSRPFRLARKYRRSVER